MNITDFNNEEILCMEGLGTFLDQTLNICFSSTEEFISNLNIQNESSSEDDRAYHTENIIPRINLN